MKALIPSLFVLALLQMGLQANRTHAGEVLRDPKQNAALQYWLAFAELPNMPDSAKGENVLAQPVGERLNEANRKYVQWTGGLPALRHGAGMNYCEWGLDEEGGPAIRMPHLAKARHLARIIAYRLQYLAEEGRVNEGVDDLVAGFTLSRHLASDSLIVTFLLHTAIDALMVERSAFFLPSLDKAHLKQLAEALEQLPPQPKSVEAVLTEKRVFGDWFKKKFMEQVKQQGVREAFKSMGMDSTELVAMKAEELAAQFDELSKYYDQLATLHTLPLQEYEKQQTQLEASVTKAGPMVRMFFPVLSRVKFKEVQSQTRMAMYRASIDVLLTGPEVLARQLDPYDGKPFTYMVTPDGFELGSNLKENNKPVKLTVGGKLTEPKQQVQTKAKPEPLPERPLKPDF